MGSAPCCQITNWIDLIGNKISSFPHSHVCYKLSLGVRRSVVVVSYNLVMVIPSV